MTKSVRCLGVTGMVVGLLIAGASSAAAQEVRPQRPLGSRVARPAPCAVQGQGSCNAQRRGATETVFDFRDICFRSLLGINDEVLADSDRFPCAQDWLPGIELGERFGDFTNATMTVWKNRNTGKLVLHDLKFVKSLGTSADDKALLKEYEHAVDLVSKLLGVSVTCPGLVDPAAHLGRQHLNPMDRRIKSQTLLNLAKGQKVEITATEASYVIRAGQPIQTSAPIVEIRLGPIGLWRSSGQNSESVKELTLGTDCSDLLSVKMRVLQEQSKLRELERAGQRQQLASIQEELKRVREAKAAAEKSECAESCSISKSSEKISVAEKLGQCDFLLNKDFKKNAKVYLCLFSASWCPPCRREMPRIAKTYAETLKDDPDIELIHFSRDPNDEKALAWAKEHEVKFPVVKPKGGNPLDLHSRGIPHLFIVKADGTLLEEGHPMKLFTEKKLKEITGKEFDLDRKPEASSGKQDFALQGEIRKLLSSAQPRKKITVPYNDSPIDLPLFTNPAEAQRKAKELGLWMFVYNMPCSRRDSFPNSSYFLKAVSKHCVFVYVKGFGSESAECPWERSTCWPCCRILYSEGNLVSSVATWSGMPSCEVSGEKMIEIFNGFVKACEIMPAAFADVERNPDEIGLSKLHDALSSLPESFVDIAYLKWAELLVKVDQSGERGWRSCYSYADKICPLVKEFWDVNGCSSDYDYRQAKRGKKNLHDVLSRIDRAAFERRVSASEGIRKRIMVIDDQSLSDEARNRLKCFRESVDEKCEELANIQKDLLAFEKDSERKEDASAAGTSANSSRSVENKSSQNKISVAEKLQTSEFLLNKDFKKNAKVYLCLFSASWCPPCRAEMPRIAKTYAETLKDDPDIELIHFSRDQNDEKALAWAKEHDVKFPVVKPKGGNPLDLHSRGIPHLFIVRADGTLLEEGHPMRIFNEEKFKEIKSGNMKPRTADADLKSGERTEQVDGYTWTYRVENGGATIVAAGGKRRCTISPSPKGSVTIPSKLGGVNVTKIGSEAFCECSGITSVTFPASVKEISWRAFSDCRSLSSVSIPSGVVKIYPAAFSGCKSLTAITVSDENMQYASRDGILFDKGMKTLVCYPGGIPGAYVIPSGVTEIGGNAFSGCSGLTSVIVPDSVTRIGEFAFSQSRGLASVALGSGVTMLGQAPFYWCSGLTSITVSEANRRYASRDGVLFDKDMKTVVCCPGGFSGEYVIPSSVTSVGRYAFDSCRKLTAVTIPSSVTKIDYHGFNYCDGLTSVVIPSSVKIVGDYAFVCRGLKAVTISEGVESIGSGAFCACFELSSAKIPSSVKKIGKYAFSSCKKMTSVVKCGDRPEIGEKAFNNCDSLKAIHVPANAKSWEGMKEWQGIPLVFDAETK